MDNFHLFNLSKLNRNNRLMNTSSDARAGPRKERWERNHDHD